MAPPSPVVAQFELASRLRRRRAQLNLSAKAVSDHLGFSPNHWSGVENNRTILAADKLAKLADLFDLDAAEIDELQALRQIARAPRWWDEYHYVQDERLAQYYGLEYGASAIRSFESWVVPGLLQTEDYARAVTQNDPDTTDARSRKRVELRLRRQRRLTEPDDDGELLELDVVVAQAALMQQNGGADVLRRQLLHLVDLIEKLDKTLQFRVIPFTTTPRGMVNVSTLHLLSFASPHMPVLAWRESVEPLGITDDRDLLEVIEVNFTRARETALSRPDSLALIRDLAEGLRST